MRRPRLLVWASSQPDRPFVILFGHCLVVVLYLTHHAVSTTPFRGTDAKDLLSSPLLPCLHGLAIGCLFVAIGTKRYKGSAAMTSFFAWAFTTGALYFAATHREPPGALWATALSSVITLAAFLMLARWGADDGDEHEGD